MVILTIVIILLLVVLYSALVVASDVDDHAEAMHARMKEEE